MKLREYQDQRLGDARNWYDTIFREFEESVPASIKYISLWAVFNALYNIADIPYVSLRRVKQTDRDINFSIRGNTEREKLHHIADKLATDKDYVRSFVKDHEEILEFLAKRVPEVEQPKGITNLSFSKDHNDYKLDLSTLRGIASLDNRVFLSDGSVLFEYHSFDFALNADGMPVDSSLFFEQIILMLYQLRNNIVHGGSAAFFQTKTELTIKTMNVLNSMVEYLFSHPEIF